MADIQKLINEAASDVVKAAVRKWVRKELAEGRPVNMMTKAILENPALPRDLFAPPPKESMLCLVTISAKDGIDPVKFVETFQSRLMKKMKKGLEFEGETVYCIEQRSEREDQQPYGWHIHWLVRFVEKSAPSARAKYIYESLTKFVTAKNYVDVKKVHDTPRDFEKVKTYMSGGKKDTEKLPKVLRDRELRKRLGIQDVFFQTA